MNPDMIHSLNSLRILSVDMINQAGSGHPGTALGAAPIIYSLYANHLKVNPLDPNWINRDRFVLSAGHGSALLYATLFMAGYDISIDDLVNFRRLNSKTPGHPELGKTPGVEVSTGPLGQGVANAVGMAIAEKYLRTLANDALPKQKLIDYYTYCLCGDGDLMEGVATEAAAIAGNLALDHLIILYDSNEVTLDGKIELSSSEDMIKKYMAMGFEVDFVQEGNDVREIDKAIERAKVNKKPTLIEIRTTIGRGSINEGKSIVHGKPLTKDDISNLRKKYKIETGPMEITENAVKYMRYSIANRVNSQYTEWHKYLKELKKVNNDSLKNLINFLENKDINAAINSNKFKIQNDYNEELRESNSKMLNILSERTKFFIGGSADVGSSTHTHLYKEIEMSKKYPAGRNIYFGVREHAMGAILNGMALSGLKVFGSCFLSFADYLLPALRMSCMMRLPVTYIFTHDSVRVGQDGPTHQPIEQLTYLRNIPNMVEFRPCDINEVIGAWDYITHNNEPTCVVLAKDEAHILAGTNGEEVKKGAYILRREKTKLDAVLVSSGIDITTIYLISEELRAKGIDTRVVSMPSMTLFKRQPKSYRESILPSNAKIISVEAGSTMCWNYFTKYTIGIDQFGISAVKDDVLNAVNFDYETILEKVEKYINGIEDEEASVVEETPIQEQPSTNENTESLEVVPTNNMEPTVTELQPNTQEVQVPVVEAQPVTQEVQVQVPTPPEVPPTQ